MREDGAIAHSCDQRHGLGRRIEADRRACRGSSPRASTTTSIVARIPGLLHGRLEHQRRARRRVLLGDVVRLVNPGADVGDRREPPRRLLDDARGRRASRSRSSPRPARRCRPAPTIAAASASSRLPAGRADHHVPCRAARAAQIRRHRGRLREVDRHVDARRSRPTRSRSGPERLVTMPAISQPCAGARLLDELAHPPVTDQSRTHGLHSRPGLSARRRIARARARSAVSRSASRITSVMFRRAAACDSIRIGTPPSASSRWLDERRIVAAGRRRPRR